MPLFGLKAVRLHETLDSIVAARTKSNNPRPGKNNPR
jgi:hypothetical protein